jgi:hypothetical protein
MRARTQRKQVFRDCLNEIYFQKSFPEEFDYTAEKSFPRGKKTKTIWAWF